MFKGSIAYLKLGNTSYELLDRLIKSIVRGNPEHVLCEEVTTYPNIDLHPNVLWQQNVWVGFNYEEEYV